jgi:D-glycero-alpha-D-manno-heptose-7-phosphate kinase
VIISRTPLRVSFVGGGSDMAAFYAQDQGAVVSTTIDKYIYITVNRKFDEKIRASYSVTEIVDCVDDVENELVREALKLTELRAGIEITSISDIPSEGTGLGSSSAYTVGLLNALHAHRGLFAGAERLAREACEIEIDRCGKAIGKQDQYIAAYGGLQFMRFNPDGSVFVDPIICRVETRRRLEDHLLLLYTGISRSAHTVLAEQRTNVEADAEHRAALRALAGLAAETRRTLCNDDVSSFGEALHEGWLIKKRLASQISSAEIDDWYSRARERGAVGGKILGAGGGGFLLLFAPPGCHGEIAAALPELRPVAFSFEPQGSKIVYVEERLAALA